MKPNNQNHPFPIAYANGVDEVVSKAAMLFEEQSRIAVESQGTFSTALSNSMVAMQVNARLGTEPYRSLIPWSKTHLFWTDGRCQHEDRTHPEIDRINKVLLSRVPIPGRNLYRLPTASVDCFHSATEYEQTVRAHFALSAGELPQFDLITLELGFDGHIASLFPGSTAIWEIERLVAATYVSHLYEHRMTMTVPLLSNATTILLLISGEKQVSMLQEALTDHLQSNHWPLQLIRTTRANVVCIIDQAAA